MTSSLSWKESISMWKLFSSAKFKDFSAVDGPCTDGFKSVAVLRGLCLKSRLDVLYMPIAQEGRPLSNIWQIKWTGVLSSELKIVWVAHEDHWKLKSKDTTAISNDDYNAFLFVIKTIKTVLEDKNSLTNFMDKLIDRSIYDYATT